MLQVSINAASEYDCHDTLTHTFWYGWVRSDRLMTTATGDRRTVKAACTRSRPIRAEDIIRDMHVQVARHCRERFPAG